MRRSGSFPSRARLALAGAVALATIAACTRHGDTNWIYSPGAHWPARSIMPANANGLLVTTNNLDDTLSFLDAQTLAPRATIPVGLNLVELEGPHHLVTSKDGQFLFIGLTETFPTSSAGPHGSHGSGTVPGYVVKMRLSDGAIVGQARVDRNPGDLVLSPDGAKLYVSHFDIKRILDQTAAGGTEDSKLSGIAVIDTATMNRDALVMVCPAEHGMAISPDGAKLYVTCYGSDSVAIVDLTQASLPHTVIPVGTTPGELPGTTSYAPYAATLSSDGRIVWLSCWNSGDLRALIVSSGQMNLAATQTVGGYPSFGAKWGDKTIFARQSGNPALADDHLVVLDAAGTIVSNFVYPSSQCVNMHQARLVPGQDGKAFLVCEGNHVAKGSILRVDLGTGAVEATAQVGVFPDALSFVGAP